MKYLYKLRDWAYIKCDSWLARIGAQNCTAPHEFDHLTDDTQLFSNSDRTGDEKG